jgi:hypothetical protein
MAKKKTQDKLAKVSGLTGNSGMVANGIHVAMNYKVENTDFVFIDDDGGWARVRKSEVNPSRDKIITCFKCKKPAVTISHYYPWEGYESNLCIDHATKRD